MNMFLTLFSLFLVTGTADEAPYFEIQTAISTKNSVKVEVLMGTGFVYCDVYPAGSAPPASTSSVIAQGLNNGYFAQLEEEVGTVEIVIDSLQPATSYDLYCASKLGVATASYPDIISNKQVFTTECCKTVTVSVNRGSYFENTVGENLISVQSDGAPTADIRVKISITDADGTVSSPFFPETITLTSTVWSVVQKSSLQPSAAGDYTVSATVEGTEANAFTVVFATDTTFTVTSTAVPPPVPALSSATFASNGLSMTVTFGSSTNKAGKASVFPCSEVLSFTGADASSCQWASGSDTTISATFGGVDRVIVGSDISVLPDTVRAVCRLSDFTTEECLEWDAVPASSVSLLAPASAVSPRVSISAPTVTGPCDSPVLDLLSSTGDGGRAWQSVSVVVKGDDATSVSAANVFFTSNYVVSPPTGIPRNILTSGNTYNFEVTLCNFLGKCTTGFHTITATDATVPVVSILGPRSRSMETSGKVLLQAQASVVQCDGSSTSSGLEFAWSVKKDDEITTLNNIAVDPSKFKLDPFQLDPSSVYDIQVTVTKTSSQEKSTASAQITVPDSPIVAAISGGSQQSVRQGASMVLDASGSYDGNLKDRSDISGLTFAWSCVQNKPVRSDTCGFDMVITGSEVTLTPKLSTTVGSEYSVTAIVSDAARESRETVLVEVSEADAPVISVSMENPVVKINPSTKLVLLGSVELAVPTNTAWSVNDPSVALTSRALTPTSQTLPTGVNSFNLVLSGNSLQGKATPYLFSLTAGAVSSVLTVYVNTAPLAGTFSVDPSEGTAMDTKFLLSADKWTDEDVPVSYEFSYLTKKREVKVVRGRAESAFDNKILAAGDSANGYALVCQVRAFDSLDAHSVLTKTVTVNQLVISSNDLKDKIANSLSASDGDVDSRKETLSVASSMLNSKDCSAAPDCGALNRDECADVENTCGECLTGFSGNKGADNSACVDPTNALGGSCSADADCASAWETCVEGSCTMKSKECKNDCSGHGVCGMVHSDTGKTATSCLMGDNLCEAVCTCDSGYGGFMCQFSEEDFAAKQDMRNQLLTNLESLTKVDEPSSDSINSWQSTLSSITQSPDELNDDSANVALNVAGAILDSEYVSAESLAGVLSAIDAASIASTSSSTGRRRRLAEMAETIALLDTYTSVTGSSMVRGQSPSTSINSMFRVSTNVPGPSGVVSVPQTEAEKLSGAQSSSLAVSGGTADQKVSVVAFSGRMYGEDEFETNTNMTSGGMRITMSDSSADKVTITIQNSGEQKYLSADPSETGWANTTCEKDDLTEHVHYCPGGPGGDREVRHQCNGEKGYTFATKCPGWSTVPQCQMMNAGVFGCEVISSTDSSITCECSVVEAKRRLDALEESGVLEVAAVSTLVVEDFGETMATAGNFNSVADIEKTLTVILMYAILWGSGLLGVFVCSMRQTHTKVTSDVSAAKLEKRKALAQATKSSEDIRSYLTTYVNEIFPSVFQPTAPSLRLWNEIAKHHRYILLFTAKGKNADTTRIITAVHLLSIQSMLMFILAVCYDLQFPTDDGTCATYTEKNSCLHEKSIFDTAAPVCRWKADESAPDDYYCEYIDTDVSLKAVIIISVVIAMFTAPINLLVDYLFIEVLSAPSPDEVKKAAADSSVNRAIKKAAAGGRRMSAAAVQTVNAARKSMFGMPAPSASFHVDTTRLVPDSAAEAQILAAHSVKNLLEDARTNIDSGVELRKTQRQHSRVLKMQEINEKKQRKYEVQADNAPASLTRRMSLGVSDAKIQEVFAELCVDMTEQRKLLKRSQQDNFDVMWGVDPTGEFSSSRKNSCCSSDSNAEAAILGEIKYVREEVAAKYNKLRFASDVQTGVEILHLFVMDLLGRDTPVAKIFLTKSEEDFRHSMVVSNWVKGVAWVVVVILNLFFVYFSMLRGLERGQKWQNMFLVACIMQFVIEMLFYETSECAIVHYFIPNLAKNEVQGVSFMLHQAVQKICSNIVDNVPLVLDAPQYLFVSTNLAQRFPDLLESVIVRSYHTYSPGELSHKWKSKQSVFAPSFTPWSRSNARVRRFTASAVFIGLLQQMGAMSPALQRVMIHTVQPLAVSLLILVLMVLVNNPLFFIIIAPFVLYKSFKLWQDYSNNGLTRVDSKLSDVHPGDEPEENAGMAADINRVRLESQDRSSSAVHPDIDAEDKAEDVRGAEGIPAKSVLAQDESSGCDEAKVGVSAKRVPASEAWSSSSEEEGVMQSQDQWGSKLLGQESDDDSVELIAHLGKSNFDVSSDESM